ncbi:MULTISPECIES: isochorismate synthase [Salinibaculum]|uniref:isochorismate synthase n=1 Tax=Salinibaculum TaxID=2732368 RepID=UPI0030CC7D87
MESVRGDGQPVPVSELTGAVRSRAIDRTSVGSFLHAVTRPRLAWGDATTTMVAGGTAAMITADGRDRFGTVRAGVEDLFDGLSVPDGVHHDARPRLFGGFAFHEGHAEPNASELWHGYPGARFVLPSVQLTMTTSGAWLTAAATGADATGRAEETLDEWESRLASLPAFEATGRPGIARKRPTPSKEGWRDQVTAATEKVRRGDLQKVVLAQALNVDLDRPVDAPSALSRLGETYPGCFRFLFEPAVGGTFFGATPERLVTLQGRTVRTEALAGSTGRGDTASEDEWLAAELRESEKDVHEHQLVVEAIREQLAPLASEIRTGSRTVRRLDTVQHLQTPIRAELASDAHVLSLVEALHPTPAVGGLPPDGALRTIRETEAFDRGWYASPIGWLDADGDGTFAVAIRSALAADSTATLFAGAGIVADSDPDEEYDELQLKYGPMLDELE